ncbi:DUF202 domain-containing protein [Alcaligenaceae bacterium]|nr:DUF202 domain-containing protein [Alcaligenaceae bacterium]
MHTVRGGEVKDKGLQPERTALAWFRTLLTWCASLILLFRLVWLTGRPAVLWAVYLLAAGAIPMAMMCWSRARHLRLARVPRPIAPALPIALSAICALSAILAIWSMMAR